MILSRAIAIIKRGCGHRTSGDQGIVDALVDAQEQLETGYPVTPLPWFLLTERATTSSVADEERLAIPSDFIMEYEGDAIWLQTPEGGEVRLKKYDQDDLRQSVARRSETEELYLQTNYRFSYALTGDYFRIFPKPPAVYSFKQIYYQRQTTLDFDDPSMTNRWLQYAPWVLIGAAGEEIAMGLRDAQAYQHFQRKKAAAIEAITTFTQERDLANRRMAMGETL